MAKGKGKNTVTLAIIGLLVVALLGFGLTDFGGSTRAVATVGKAEVSTQDYARAIQNQMSRFQAQTGQSLSFQQARSLGVDQIALGQLITGAALENETITLGLSVGDDTVGQRIQGMQEFVNASGNFDRQVYEATLRQNGLNAGEFEARIRGDVSEALLQSAVGAGIETPDVFVDTFYNFARETRDATWVRLGEADLAEAIPAPTDDELAAFHEENSADFMRPETKTIRYALLTPDMLVDDIEVDEAQLQTLYDSRLSEYIQPERRLVERLVFLGEAQAADAMARLEAGEVTFDSLVAERGLELSDIDLGDVSIEDLDEAGEGVFALSEPGVVGPLPSDLGPALFRMNGILAASETSFDEARDELRLEAASDRARRIILDVRGTVDDLLAGGADMSVLAERTDMEEGTIDYNTGVFEGVAAYAAFRNAAASAAPGDFAEVVELDDGGLVAMVVEKVEEPTVLPLDEVRNEVTDAWSEVETETALTALAETLIGELQSGTTLEALELTAQTPTGLDRSGFVEGTPPDFISALFDLDEGEYTTLSADGDVWILRLDATTLPDLESPEAKAERELFAQQSSGDFANAVMSAFSQAIVNSAGIEMNQAAINAVHAQLP